MDEELEEDDYVLNIKTVKYVDASDVFSGCSEIWDEFYNSDLYTTHPDMELNLVSKSEISGWFKFRLSKNYYDDTTQIQMLKVLDRLDEFDETVLLNIDSGYVF